MEPVNFKEANTIFRLDGCNDLPAYVGEMEVNGLGKVPIITHVWQLTTDELITLMSSGKIAVNIVGTTMPPIMLGVIDD